MKVWIRFGMVASVMALAIAGGAGAYAMKGGDDARPAVARQSAGDSATRDDRMASADAAKADGEADCPQEKCADPGIAAGEPYPCPPDSACIEPSLIDCGDDAPADVCVPGARPRVCAPPEHPDETVVCEPYYCEPPPQGDAPPSPATPEASPIVEPAPTEPCQPPDCSSPTVICDPYPCGPVPMEPGSEIDGDTPVAKLLPCPLPCEPAPDVECIEPCGIVPLAPDGTVEPDQPADQPPCPVPCVPGPAVDCAPCGPVPLPYSPDGSMQAYPCIITEPPCAVSSDGDVTCPPPSPPPCDVPYGEPCPDGCIYYEDGSGACPGSSGSAGGGIAGGVAPAEPQ